MKKAGHGCLGTWGLASPWRQVGQVHPSSLFCGPLASILPSSLHGSAAKPRDHGSTWPCVSMPWVSAPSAQWMFRLVSIPEAPLCSQVSRMEEEIVLASCRSGSLVVQE